MYNPKRNSLYKILSLLLVVFSIFNIFIMSNFIAVSAIELTDEESVKVAKEALVIPMTGDMLETDIILPVHGENDTSIEWSSDNVQYLDNSGRLLIRPLYSVGPEPVVLTAKISKNNASEIKSFPINIMPTPNILANPGFEDDYNNWKTDDQAAYPPGTHSINPVISSTEHHSGNKSLLVSNYRAASWERITSNSVLTANFIHNKQYLFSAWYKIKDKIGEIPDSNFKLEVKGKQLGFSQPNSLATFTKNTPVTLSSTNWVEIRTVVKVDNTADLLGDILYFNCPNEYFDKYTYYVDDYSVQPLVPYTLTTSGPTSIFIPVGANKNTETYTYNFLNQFGTKDDIATETAVWSVVGNPAGVSIESNTGKLQVDATATEGTILVRAASSSYDWLKKDFKVQLQNMPAIAPTAKNVQVTTSTSFETPGISAVGDILTASYQYEDENLDMESGSTYKWIATNIESSLTGEVIGSGDISANTNATYTVKQSNVGKYIKFIVTPRSAIIPRDGIETSGNAILIQAAPIVKDVKIVGTPAVGTELYGSYIFSHPNGYLELGSTYRWISGGQVIGTGATYTVTSSDAGKSIYFEVTPASKEEPRVGSPVASQSVNIPQASSGRGGSSGSSGGTSITVVKPVETAKPTPTPVIEEIEQFNDLNNHWAKADVEQLVEKGIIKGKDANTFAPDLSINRAEFAAIIVRALGIKEIKFNNSFNDVSDSLWYADIVQTVSDNKLIVGNEGLFRPDDSITREEMAKIIVEAYKIMTEKELPQENPIQFEDQDNMGIWAVEYINSATELGLINGIDNTHFDPKAVATRAQAAVIIKRLLDKK